MKKLDVSKFVYALMMIIVFTISQAFGQITVTHFNAEWNSANKVEWFSKLDDCDLTDVDIIKEPKLQDKHKIVIVPTIIIFKDGEEIKRYQADLSFKLLATRKEIQGFINEQIMSDF
jgi:hypothetical protein